MRMLISLSAVPRMSDRTKTYYHGTDSMGPAQAILRDGLDPNATAIKYGDKKGFLRPADNCVYITPNLRYAIIYALGGDMAGRDLPPHMLKDAHGCLFEFDGEHLIDVQPDEDGVGLIVHLLLSRTPEADLRRFYGKSVNVDALLGDPVLRGYVNGQVQYALTPKQFDAMRGMKGGEIATQAQVGKKLVKHMPDAVKMAFIDAGCHVAHKGVLRPKAAYMIDKRRCAELDKDGSNFFDIAEKIA